MIDLNHCRNLAARKRANYFHVPFLLSVLVAALERPSLLIFGWLILATPVAVQAEFNYTITDGTVTIDGYTGSGGVVVIPDTITGLPVTAIGFLAFARSTNLTSVTMGNGVRNITEAAFQYCINVISVTIPNSVTNIGDNAFLRCSSLTSVTIGNGVPKLGEGVLRAAPS